VVNRLIIKKILNSNRDRPAPQITYVPQVCQKPKLVIFIYFIIRDMFICSVFMPMSVSLFDTQKVSNISQKVTDLAIFGSDPHPEQIRKLRSLLLFFLFRIS
jgi:hypothetical protein